jgi:hypothetical protein
MYPPSLVEALRARGVAAFTALELGLAGHSDLDPNNPSPAPTTPDRRHRDAIA